MNEKIDELAKQCYVKTGNEYTDHFAYWKFAELIIEECCDQVRGIDAMEIRRHFGIDP